VIAGASGCGTAFACSINIHNMSKAALLALKLVAVRTVRLHGNDLTSQS
jgi:hypothetical protein